MSGGAQPRIRGCLRIHRGAGLAIICGCRPELRAGALLRAVPAAGLLESGTEPMRVAVRRLWSATRALPCSFIPTRVCDVLSALTSLPEPDARARRTLCGAAAAVGILTVIVTQAGVVRRCHR